jgi:hypothetical protein
MNGEEEIRGGLYRALGRHEPEPKNEHRSRGISFVIEKYDKLTNGKGGFGKA